MMKKIILVFIVFSMLLFGCAVKEQDPSENSAQQLLEDNSEIISLVSANPDGEWFLENIRGENAVIVSVTKLGNEEAETMIAGYEDYEFMHHVLMHMQSLDLTESTYLYELEDELFDKNKLLCAIDIEQKNLLGCLISWGEGLDV
jgi:hypothetical protein